MQIRYILFFLHCSNNNFTSQCWWECWNMRAPLYHELTLTRLAPPAHFSGCFLFVSWGVWVDTSTPPVYQSFYHLTTAMSPFERKQEVPNHTQTPAGASRGFGVGGVDLSRWSEWLNQIQDPFQTTQVNSQHVFLLTSWFHLDKSETLWETNMAVILWKICKEKKNHKSQAWRSELF